MVERLVDKQIYAIKKVTLRALPKKERENALNEIRILASLDHESIIGYKESFFDEKNCELCIVLEYADGGDMSHKIEEHKKAGSYF